MANPDGNTTGPSESQHDRRIDAIIESCMTRCEASEVVDEARIIAENPELMPQLGERLRAMRLVLAADRATKEGRPLAGSDPAEIPQVLRSAIPGYELVREIHHGGQGAVYLAIQKATRRKVAVKIMREGLFGDSKGKARFDREVRLLAAIRHSNILPIHDSGTASCGQYFVMDYISGLPLDRYVQDKGLSGKDVLRLFRTVCEAVNAAHLKGIVHRDLKPGNILVDDAGTPYVLDFGLARVAGGDVTGDTHPQIMTTTGQFVGSLPWSAPEQAEGKSSKIDTRTDVYALGVLLYQLLTGDFPYDVSGNMPQVIGNILHTPPSRPSTIRRRLSADAETIVLKALSKERERRYQTAGDLARDIDHVLGGEPIEAKRASTLYVLSKSVRRHRAGMLVAACLVIVAGAAAWLGHRWTTKVPPAAEKTTLTSSSLLTKVRERYEEEKERNLQKGVPKELFRESAPTDAVDDEATLRRVLSSAPKHFFPLRDPRDRDDESDLVTELIFDPLVFSTAWGDSHPNPALVKGNLIWSEDHTRCELHLRQGAQWHDGEPVEAADVRFTWELLRRLSLKESEALISDIAPSGNAVVFHFRRPCATASTEMNFRLLPRHLFEPIMKAETDPRQLRDRLNGYSRDHPIGCGPYRLRSVKGDLLTLERFANYEGTPPCFKTVIFRVQRSENERLQLFLRDELDAFELTDDQFAQFQADASLFEAGNPVQFSINRYNVVLWNIRTHRELFEDERVRRALAHAFHLSKAMQAAFLDPRDMVASVFPIRSWAYEVVPEVYRYSPDQARRLLRDAGWELRDGVQKNTDASGRSIEFRFSVLVSQDSATSWKIMEAFAADMKAIGIEVELDIRPKREFDQRLMDHDFMAAMCGLQPSVDPGLERRWWHSEDPLAKKSVTPVSCGYKNEKVNALFEAADTTFDMVARRDLYAKLQQLVYDDQPVMFLYHRPAKWAMSKRLRGVEFGIRGPFGFYPGVRAWWTPKALP